MNETGEEGEGEEGSEAAVYNVSSAVELNKLFDENTLKDGDTIKLSAGTYEIGARSIPAVSIYGTDDVVIVGSLSYEFAGNTSVKISKVTLQAPEDNTTVEQAINLKKADGTVLTVENCKIVDYLYGISVNSEAKNCKLKANLTLDNVWCGVSVKGGDAGNKVGNLSVASGSTVDYETQEWGSKDGESYNGYCVTQGAEPVQATEPNLANGEWPAPPPRHHERQTLRLSAGGCGRHRSGYFWQQHLSERGHRAGRNSLGACRCGCPHCRQRF